MKSEHAEQIETPNSDMKSEAEPDKALSSEVNSEVERNSTNPPDPFDLNSLWAPMPLAATQHQVLNIRASTRPPRDKFIRVMPFSIGASVETYENCRPVYLFEYEFDGDLTKKSFYVRPGTEVAALLAERERLSAAVLVLGKVRHGNPFIWELKIPNGRNESADKWAQSRLEIAKRAASKWLKPVANVSAGGYDYDEPVATYDDPDWSTLDFDKAIQAACKDRVIDSAEHDAVKEALGL